MHWRAAGCVSTLHSWTTAMRNGKNSSKMSSVFFVASCSPESGVSSSPDGFCCHAASRSSMKMSESSSLSITKQ